MTPANADEAPARGPNVVLITSHDLGRFLHCYGVPTVSSPNLDRLAGDGIRFSAAFATAPQCSPSRASLATGRYPHANGVMGLTHGHFGWDLRETETHLAAALRAEAGYATGLVGVHHESYQGAPETIAARCGFDTFEPGGTAETVRDRALARLDGYAAADRPFYLQVGFLEVHRLGRSGDETPEAMGFLGDHLEPDDAAGVTIPAYLRDTPGTRREIAELQGSVRHLDAAVGAILDRLDTLGLADDTLVIFTTDHGLPLPRAKCSLYDPGLETALIMRLPARGWTGGRVIDAPVSNVDLMPTILTASGRADLVEDDVHALHGIDLAPVLDGRAEPSCDRALFGEMTYHDYYDPRRSIRTAQHKLIANFTSAPAFMNPSQSWRPRSDVAVPADPATAYHPPVELYDLVADPGETRDLAEDPAHADVRRELSSRLYAWMANSGDPLLHGAVDSPMHRTAVAVLRGSEPPPPAAPFG